MEIKKKTTIFYLFLIIALLYAIFAWHNFSFFPKFNKMNIIIETAPNNIADVLLKKDGKLYAFPKSKNVLNFEIKDKTENLDILINKKYKNEIKNIVIFNNIESYIFQDFSEFSKSEEKICQNDLCEVYNAYKIDNNKINNKTSHFNQFSSLFLEFFKGNKIFFVSYVLIFISILYFINNRKDIKVHSLILPILLITIGIILRLNEISTYLPWGDEKYSITISNSSFLNIFSDPGNPPFYYFILKIYNYIFSSNILVARILSIIFGILCNIVLYLFLKKNIDNKTANIALLLSSINIILIYYSQELRSYILQALFAILITYCTFEIIKNNKKFFYYYLIFAIFAINTHYYQSLFIIANFLFLTYFLIKEKRYNDFKKIILINFLAFISFCPYLIFTLLKGIVFSENFNTHLESLNLNLIKNNLLYIFSGGISLIFCLIFFIKNLFDKKTDLIKKNILIYSGFIIFFIFIFALIISAIFKPIISQKYFSFLIPFFIILISIIVANIKNKFLLFLSIAIIFQIQNYTSKNFQNIRKKHSIQQIADDFNKSFSNKNTILILKGSYQKPIIKNENTYHVSLTNNSQDIEKETLNLIKNIKKDDNLIFTTIFLPSKKSLNLPKNFTCFFNSATDLCVWKIE